MAQAPRRGQGGRVRHPSVLEIISKPAGCVRVWQGRRAGRPDRGAGPAGPPDPQGGNPGKTRGRKPGAKTRGENRDPARNPGGDAVFWAGDLTPKETIMTLDDLFLLTLKDIYYAERQLLKALPKMAKAAQSPDLKAAFTAHRAETETQVERLQQVFAILGKRAAGQTCEAIQGLIEECEELLEEATQPSAVRDAGLIACGQAVEHYEMARYGTLVAWAEALGMADAAALLTETLTEEKAADSKLGGLASGSINEEARAAA